MNTNRSRSTRPSREGAGRFGAPRWAAVAACLVAVVIVLGFLAGAALLLRTREWEQGLWTLVAWIRSRGAEAVLWLFALQALQVVLALPGPFFTLGAGFLLGPGTGLLVAVGGSTAGSAAAYGLARLARARREAGGTVPGEGRWASAPRLQALGRFVREGGWRIVLSSRLIPLFPFKLSNYFFGWIRFPFAAFFWGTFFGIAPVTLLSVTTGALAADLAAPGHVAPPSAWRWGTTFATLAAAAILLAWAGRRARARMRAEAPDAPGSAENGGEAEP